MFITDIFDEKLHHSDRGNLAIYLAISDVIGHRDIAGQLEVTDKLITGSEQVPEYLFSRLGIDKNRFIITLRTMKII